MAAKKENADFYLMLDEINCKKRTFRNVTFTAYFNGENVYTSKSEGAWQYAIPDSMMEGSIIQICAKDKEVYMGDNSYEAAERTQKWLDEEIAKSTPQKNPASF